MAKEHFDIAIVMVSYNKISDLPSVARLMEQSSLRMAFVCVDNASTKIDVQKEVTAHIKDAIVILRDGNYGMGSSSNKGAREVSADYYFFLNPDTFLKDSLVLDRLYAFMREHPKVGIVAPRLHYPDGRLQETCRRFPKWYMPFVQRLPSITRSIKKWKAYADHFVMKDYDHVTSRMVDWVQGSAFLIDAALFHEVGGFDDHFWMYFEDTDLCRKVWEKGRPVYYVPSVVIMHEYGKGSEAKNGLVRTFLRNKLARAHIKSWLAYTSKWRGKSL